MFWSSEYLDSLIKKVYLLSIVLLIHSWMYLLAVFIPFKVNLVPTLAVAQSHLILETDSLFALHFSIFTSVFRFL